MTLRLNDCRDQKKGRTWPGKFENKNDLKIEKIMSKIIFFFKRLSFCPEKLSKRQRGREKEQFALTNYALLKKVRFFNDEKKASF